MARLLAAYALTLFVLPATAPVGFAADADVAAIRPTQSVAPATAQAQETSWPPADALRPGNGITVPRPLRQAKPQYTTEAMRAKVQGAVFLECVVEPDGTVHRVRVTRSLDPTFGLDDEAVKAAKQWRFTPGTKDGQPVPVLVTIELTFTLRDGPPGASGQAAALQCRHDANESASEEARRRNALAGARLINTLEATQPGARSNQYLDVAALAQLAAGRPPASIPLSFNPGTELLPGFDLRLAVTDAGYWFMIRDKTDPCGFAYISNQQGVIYRSEPIR
jgi:TonB family protein